VGERQWQSDHASVPLEIARREGQVISCCIESVAAQEPSGHMGSLQIVKEVAGG